MRDKLPVTEDALSLRDRQRAQVHADIRRAAFRLFAAKGFDAVTTEQIALLRVSPPVPSSGMSQARMNCCWDPYVKAVRRSLLCWSSGRPGKPQMWR